MFDFFGPKLLILLAVALIVVGPKDLPKFMHMIGRWLGKARAMANEFRRSFDEMARQTELDELRKEIEALKSKNPLADFQQSLNEQVNADAPSVSEPEPDEPRAGEFQITDTPVPAQVVAAEPAPASSSERAAS